MSLIVKEREREREWFDRGGEKLRPCGRVGERLAPLGNERENEVESEKLGIGSFMCR